MFSPEETKLLKIMAMSSSSSENERRSALTLTKRYFRRLLLRDGEVQAAIRKAEQAGRCAERADQEKRFDQAIKDAEEARDAVRRAGYDAGYRRGADDTKEANRTVGPIDRQRSATVFEVDRLAKPVVYVDRPAEAEPSGHFPLLTLRRARGAAMTGE